MVKGLYLIGAILQASAISLNRQGGQSCSARHQDAFLFSKCLLLADVFRKRGEMLAVVLWEGGINCELNMCLSFELNGLACV